MKSIYIVVIIILMAETECFIQDTTSIKILEEQRTLLRKLQNFQDPKDEKPLTWNEMLADVLVNRIKIFSFNKVNENEIIDDSKPSKAPNFVRSYFSEVMFLFKNCIYDKFVTKYEEPDYKEEDLGTDAPEIFITDDIDSLNDDVELIEPKYHGKQLIVEPVEAEDKALIGCPEGTVKDDKGNCVKAHSRLLISVPSQCPMGYRRDKLGFCRAMFSF
ncbi:hypothetical protein HW555_011437 [Spodoptera exigua]|uniref:Uncharacterized protein n=1 Tax=Spodoptera exigua TaxID=7107 RepID=A0A835G716_SPOEX|nr:hypothetical protein HW555_011437 [Spodoptera exigua]